MKYSDDLVKDYQKDMKENHNEDISDELAQDHIDRLASLVELLWEIHQKESARKHRLKTEPEGFAIDGGYSCLICSKTVVWYSKYGLVCNFCRRALDENRIPLFIRDARNSYFMSWALKSTFDINHMRMKKYIKEGKLIARTILDDNGRVHEYVFLKKENPGLIERHSPARKSYDRKRKKILDKQNREWKKKALAEHRKEMEKLREKLKVN